MYSITLLGLSIFCLFYSSIILCTPHTHIFNTITLVIFYFVFHKLNNSLTYYQIQKTPPNDYCQHSNSQCDTIQEIVTCHRMLPWQSFSLSVYAHIIITPAFPLLVFCRIFFLRMLAEPWDGDEMFHVKWVKQNFKEFQKF